MLEKIQINFDILKPTTVVFVRTQSTLWRSMRTGREGSDHCSCKERQAQHILYHGRIAEELAGAATILVRVAFGPAPALKGVAGASKIVGALACAYSAAVLVLDPWPARPFISAAQVLVATIRPPAFRWLCTYMYGYPD